MKVYNETVKEIESEDLYALKTDQKKFWDGITVIGDASFSNLENLKHISLPSKITEIGNFSFAKSKIETIKLNRGLIYIRDNAFYNCNNLIKIKLPSTVSNVGKKAFMNCNNLKDVILSKNLSNIYDDMFYGCNNLKKIVIPNNVLSIRRGAFGSSGIENIKLSKQLKTIGSYAFSSCFDLKKIWLTSDVKKIGVGAFQNSGLRRIHLNKNLKVIEDNAFSFCKYLESVDLPDSVDVLGKDAFKESSISKINISKDLTYISTRCFCDCINLEKIAIHENIKILKEYCFANAGLKEVKIEEGLKTIEKYAFLNCSNIDQIEIPYSVNKIEENAFEGCNFNHIYKIDDGKWILSKKELNRSDIVESYNVSEIGEVYCKVLPLSRHREIMERLKVLKKNHISVTNECYENADFMRMIFYNDNYDFMKRLSKKLKLEGSNKKYSLAFYKLLYNLGAFNDEILRRQKASNFIENLLDKYLINLEDISVITEKMKLGDHNPEWVEFIMKGNNLLELIKVENSGRDELIANTYNRFNELKEFCRSNKGNQRYLKPTVDKTLQCFAKVPFNGINESNEDISAELSKFTSKQSTFEEANEIRELYLMKKNQNIIKDHILGEELKENYFNKIEELKNDILKDAKEGVETLNNIASKKFTYEFLSKYDPKNFVIGKYCSCCAHLESIGKGIVEASILHPNCQNLIIKNSKGRIVAKAILYVNKEQGYGVFNNVEVADDIDADNKNIIYEKFKKGVNDFATRYNELNKDKPITQINVGMNFNDLKIQIMKNDMPGDILRAIDFSDFTYPYSSHSGDWQDEQYVIWKK